MAEKEKKQAPKKKNKSTIRKDKPYKESKSCPRCGSGFALAEHKDRRTCGRCKYTEKK